MTSAPLFDTPDNPVPPLATSGWFDTHDGLKLRFAVFRSPQSPAKGTVVLLQGRNESIEKYFETIRSLTAMGLWVATFDLRGQGLSPRLTREARRGHVRRFADYERDLSAFLEQIVLPDTRLPFYLLGHSTGALIALSAAPRLATRIERMVLSSPFVGLGGWKVPVPVIRLVAGLASLVGLGARPLTGDHTLRPFEGNPLTSDPVRYARNLALAAAHPELMLGAPSARWLAETLGTIAAVTDEAHLRRITIPTIILAPTLDPVVPYRDQEMLARRFRACELVPIAGARHELFQERDRFRAAALAAIGAFIPGADAENMPDDERIGSAL